MQLLKYPGLPENSVFGSGTIFRYCHVFVILLSQRFDVDSRSVHAYIIGEHGDSEVPVWSLANIAGMRLEIIASKIKWAAAHKIWMDIFSQTEMRPIRLSREKMLLFMRCAGIVRLLEATLRDQSTVLSVSSMMHNYYGMDDVCFSLPTVIDRGGVERVIKLKLDDDELEGLRNSATVLKKTIQKLDLL